MACLLLGRNPTALQRICRLGHLLAQAMQPPATTVPVPYQGNLEPKTEQYIIASHFT